MGRYRRHAPAFWLWLSLFLPAATIYHPNAGWNVNTRLDLVFAWVDQGSARIDDYHDLPPYDTGDKALFDGHFYSDKVFGLSLLGVPPYAVLKAAMAVFGREPGYATAHWWIRIWAVGALAAGAGVLLWRFFQKLGMSPRAAFWFVQAVFYGTLCFPYSTVFYPYLPGVFFCLLAWEWIEREGGSHLGHPRLPAPAASPPVDSVSNVPRVPGVPDVSCVPSPRIARHSGTPSGSGVAFLIGLSLGCAMIMDFIFGLAVAALAGRALWNWRGRGVGRGGRRMLDRHWFANVAAAAVGGAIPLGAFAIYTVAIFGALSIPYRYEADPLFRIGMSQGFMGVTGFQPAALWYLTLHPYRGLFFWSPILASAAAGAVRMLVGERPAGGRNGKNGTDGTDETYGTERPDATDQVVGPGGTREAAGIARAASTGFPRFTGALGLGLATAYLAFNASYYMWWGGWAMGPRLLIPAIPFLALGLAGIWNGRPAGLVNPIGQIGQIRRIGRISRIVSVGLAVLSAGLILPPALVDPQTPMWFHKWPDLLHPAIGQNLDPEQFIQIRMFFQGRIGATLGGLMGLPGLWALIPTALAWIGPVALFSRSGADVNMPPGGERGEDSA